LTDEGLWNSDGLTVFGGIDAAGRITMRLIPELGIVEFSSPLYRARGVAGTEGPTGHEPAILYLACTVNIKKTGTLEFDRYERVKQWPGIRLGTGSAILMHEEIVREVIPVIDEDGNATGQIQTNDSYIKPAIDSSLVLAAQQYQATTAIEATYPGLVPISPD